MKLTFVDACESPEQHDRKDFFPACRYGRIEPDENEIGGIFVNVRNARLERGMWAHDAECIERIFLRDKNGAKQ